MKKKIRGQLLVMLILGILVISSVKVYALKPPYLSLKTSQDIITNDNAVLHAELANINANITGFEIFIYKDDILVKSGFKKNTDNSYHINIVFDLKKDLSIVLIPDTTYKYTIYARSNTSISRLCIVGLLILQQRM